jgi:hypothetical protein
MIRTNRLFDCARQNFSRAADTERENDADCQPEASEPPTFAGARPVSIMSAGEF